MYIVIIGCGRMGSSLANELSAEGHDVSIIDNVQVNLDRLGSGFNGNRIKGVEFDTDILIESGIKNADVFLAMTPDDNTNIMASQIAKEIFNVNHVIARVFDPSREFIYKKLGIETLSATKLSVNVAKSKIIDKGADILASLDENITIVEIPVLKLKYDYVAKIQEKYNCVISAIIRDGNVILSSPDIAIQFNDKIICTINKKNRESLVNAIAKEAII